ncbi:DUF4178 domain-containing protein [Fulvivirga sp. M361]|uniref:DUF4178 domain-containing protein n=1 Tax=Fulvivirga sp. M361 TaxID=2594266 RepID=UPI00117AF1E3|nr:DUF4178 domain-containing protein [Fulvivirga sp. M361]TRX50663.1 DUF4178 domain-containing protein [Fulvivirga sp. M361]
MGLFDFLKKKEKEPEYDVTNLSVKDLDQGFILEYDMKSWEIKEVYEYDWGGNNISREYMMDAGDEVIYLGVEDEGELFITAMKNIKIRKLGDDIIDKTIKKERPPKKLEYEGIKYHLHTDNAGYFNDKTKGTDDWEELVSWDYYDDEEVHILSITQWGERDFEASVGKVVKAYQISNIIPGQ